VRRAMPPLPTYEYGIVPMLSVHSVRHAMDPLPTYFPNVVGTQCATCRSVVFAVVMTTSPTVQHVRSLTRFELCNCLTAIDRTTSRKLCCSR
jgi:hypothetical protein